MKDFKNVEEMKKSITLMKGDVAQTLGYYEVNDDGGGIYEIVDDINLKSNGGSVHDLENGLKAKLIINNTLINVKQFGAKGDGKTDDLNSIQKAIDFCGSNKLELFFSRGIYSVSDTLVQKYEVNIGFNKACIKASKQMEKLYFIRTNSTVSLKEFRINNMCLDGNGLADCGLLITDSRRAQFFDTMVQNCKAKAIDISNTKGWCNDCGGINMNKTIIKISSKDFLQCGYSVAMSVSVTDCIINETTIINYRTGIINENGANIYNTYHPYISYEELLDESVGFIQNTYNGFLNNYYDDTYQTGIYVKKTSKFIITNPFMYIHPNYYKILNYEQAPFFIKFEDNISIEDVFILNGIFEGLVTQGPIKVIGGFFSNDLSGKLNIDNCQFNYLYNITINSKQKNRMQYNFYNQIKNIYNKRTFNATVDEIAKIRLIADLQEDERVTVTSYPDSLVLNPKSVGSMNNCTIEEIKNGYKIQSGEFAETYVNAARIKFSIPTETEIYYISYKIKTNKLDGYNASGASGISLNEKYYGYCSKRDALNKYQVINNDGSSEIWLTFTIGPNEIIEITDINICRNKNNDIHKIVLKSSQEYVDIPVFSGGAIRLDNENYDVEIIG